MNKDVSPLTEPTPDVRRMIVKWVIQAIVGLVGFGLLLFYSAGSVTWMWGWVLLIVLAAFMAAHPLLLVPINPELLAEREKGSLDRDVKRWDKWITTTSGVMMLVVWVVAGLESRFRWTDGMSLMLHIGGFVVSILGYALFMWAMVSNAFFSEGVRIQEERGHVVATDGPYRFVRHPGYSGVLMADLATPFLLGSFWALVPAVILALLFLVRTALEDKTLQAELPGYMAFTKEVRFRLLPGVW